jgi:ribosomal protein S18 acetylase RimI-like enzyme
MFSENTDTRVRAAQQTDLAAVAELFDAYRQFYQQAQDLALATRFIQDRWAQQESLILVADSPTSGLLGFCQLYPSFCSVQAQPIYVLYDLFVAASARKAGIGRSLLLAAEAKARADGKTRMDLTTARDNFAAQSLYESLGWVRDEVFLSYSRQISDLSAP